MAFSFLLWNVPSCFLPQDFCPCCYPTLNAVCPQNSFSSTLSRLKCLPVTKDFFDQVPFLMHLITFYPLPPFTLQGIKWNYIDFLISYLPKQSVSSLRTRNLLDCFIWLEILQAYSKYLKIFVERTGPRYKYVLNEYPWVHSKLVNIYTSQFSHLPVILVTVH